MSSQQPPIKVSTAQTDEEKKNIEVVLNYMSTAYSPENNKGRDSVKHLCTADSTFTAPTTFPTCHSKQVPQRFIPFLRWIPKHCCSNTFETRNSPTRKGWNPNKKSLIGELVAPLDYADSHAKVMSAIADLHIISYDIVFSKGGHVLLRYSAEGSHCGQPHNCIEPSGKKAKWTAAAIFEVKDGKVHSFTKEWDKLNMWKQLGWMKGDDVEDTAATLEMTTAHRPTFDPARGKDAQRGVAYHQRLLPAHTQLKTRQPGQGGDVDPQIRDLRAQLLEAEAAHFSKTNPAIAKSAESTVSSKRQLEGGPGQNEEEDLESKRRRILEETRDVDADSDDAKSDDSSEEDSDDEEDETAELLRELEKIKKERADQKEKEEREKAAAEQEKRENDIALGNPLLMPSKDTETKRRWDDDVVFRNQARGTENKGKKEFVNDLLRSDFHKRFMSKYVR